MSERKPTKKERQEQARLERQELLRNRARRERNRKIAIVLGAVVVVGVVAVVAFGGSSDDVAAGPPTGVEDFEITDRNHVEGPVDYAQDPPAGGDHNQVWLNCAAYDEPVVSENAVHSLEHGAVWITYQPDLPAGQIDEIQGLADPFVLVSPYPGLDSPAVATSWGHQLRVQDVADGRLEQFVRTFAQGPDTPELGSPCTGGIMG
ncbi:MAG: DUF3105 domain-containing protein [Actinomycetota bacterium]